MEWNLIKQNWKSKFYQCKTCLRATYKEDLTRQTTVQMKGHSASCRLKKRNKIIQKNIENACKTENLEASYFKENVLLQDEEKISFQNKIKLMENQMKEYRLSKEVLEEEVFKCRNNQKETETFISNMIRENGEYKKIITKLEEKIKTIYDNNVWMLCLNNYLISQ